MKNTATDTMRTKAPTMGPTIAPIDVDLEDAEGVTEGAVPDDVPPELEGVEGDALDGVEPDDVAAPGLTRK
jgi:hypothetical protein